LIRALPPAPQWRAKNPRDAIISELEQTARGPYGDAWLLSFNGNLDCCITIRTALLKAARLTFKPEAGGSTIPPRSEYQETVISQGDAKGRRFGRGFTQANSK